MKFYYRAKQLILLSGDLLSFVAGFYIALLIRMWAYPSVSLLESHANLFATTFILWIVVNYINGLYDLHLRSNKTIFDRRMLSTATMSLVVGIIFFYIIPSRAITPKTILLLTVTFGYGFSYVWRIAAAKIIGLSKLQSAVVFVGHSPEIADLAAELQKHPEHGYTVSAIVDPEGETTSHESGIDVYKDLKAIRPVISNNKVDLVVIATHLHDDEHTMRELYQLLFGPYSLCTYLRFMSA